MPKISQYPSQSGASVANGDLIPIVDVGSPNVTERITVDELAQAPQFSSRYASVNDMVWLDATNLDSNGGAAIGRFQYQSQMLFDQSSGEIAGWKMYLPSWWSTFHIDMWWTHNVSGGSGNVTWEFGYGRYADGAPLSATTSLFNASGTIAAPAQGVAKVTQLNSTAISRTAGTMMGGYIYRIANDAADTFNGDVGVLGLLFRRVS